MHLSCSSSSFLNMEMTYEVRKECASWLPLVIKAKLINTVPQLDQSLRDLLASITKGSQDERRGTDHRCVVGLDIEKDCRPCLGADVYGGNNQVTEKVAVLKLCYGGRCLIIHLLHFKEAPSSLSAFLQLNWISFAGVGIRHCLEALDMNYGIKCRNAVDLGQLAAVVFGQDRYRWYGLVDLAKMYFPKDVSVTKKLMSSSSGAALSNWCAATLSEQQLEAAAVHAFVCFNLGHNLLKAKRPVYMNIDYD
ncbi:hypothetical protein SOVF_052770 [Spinacia oleracea]|nr:hypothetical protein SOVF_052770 [Spinacia oleracea]